MPPIPWDRLFDLLFKYLEECMDDNDGANRLAFIKDHPLRVRMGVNSALRECDYTGLNLIKARREVLSEINSASDEEIKAFATSGPEGLL